MINILVTGAKGQLGQCIADSAANFENVNLIYTDFQELDICNKDEVLNFFSNNESIDFCVNCAAYTAVDKAEDDIKMAELLNIEGPRNLANACLQYDVVMIHISTDFVFDGKNNRPYKESDQPNPLSVYGSTKLKGEKEVSSILKKYYILRTSWLYSEYGNNFLKTMLSLAKNKDEISVVNDQIGTPTYAGDLSNVILRLVLTNNHYYGLYHFSNDGQISWFGFALEIFKLIGSSIKLKPIMTNEYPTAAERPKFSVLDKSKINSVLGVKASDWQNSLVKCLSKLG